MGAAEATLVAPERQQDRGQSARAVIFQLWSQGGGKAGRSHGARDGANSLRSGKGQPSDPDNASLAEMQEAPGLGRSSPQGPCDARVRAETSFLRVPIKAEWGAEIFQIRAGTLESGWEARGKQLLGSLKTDGLAQEWSPVVPL